jgi:hypothetical protein
VPNLNDLSYKSIDVEGVILMYAEGVDKDQKFMDNFRQDLIEIKALIPA